MYALKRSNTKHTFINLPELSKWRIASSYKHVSLLLLIYFKLWQKKSNRWKKINTFLIIFLSDYEPKSLFSIFIDFDFVSNFPKLIAP